MDALLHWVRNTGDWVWWVGGASLVVFLATLAAIPLLVVNMRADYFLHPEPSVGGFRSRHPVLRWTVLITKNLLGVVLVLAGIAMFVLPGQGVLTVLIGVSLLDFPGKRRLELRIVRQRAVLAAIDWIRKRAGKPRLALPPREHDSGSRAPAPGADQR